MIVKLNEQAMFALGFDAVAVEALRHLLRMTGAEMNSQTLPEAVMQVGLQQTASINARAAEVRKEVDALRAQVQTLTRTLADLTELRKYSEAMAVRAIFPPQATDWEHPGKLGNKTPNTAKISTLNVDPAITGTVALPALYLATDTTTGLYRPSLNQWAMTINGTLFATFSATKALYAQNVETAKQFVSTVAIGTAPLVVTSTTQVANLYGARAVLADTATIMTNPTTYPANATDLPTVITLANALKAANIAKGV